jgi:hypothetical protein
LHGHTAIKCADGKWRSHIESESMNSWEDKKQDDKFTIYHYYEFFDEEGSV